MNQSSGLVIQKVGSFRLEGKPWGCTDSVANEPEAEAEPEAEPEPEATPDVEPDVAQLEAPMVARDPAAACSLVDMVKNVHVGLHKFSFAEYRNKETLLYKRNNISELSSFIQSEA